VCPESYPLLIGESPKNRMIQAIFNLPPPTITTCLLNSSRLKMSFHLVCELYECKRTLQSHHVVLPSLMMPGSEMIETLKINVYSPISRSINMPRPDSGRYSKSRRVYINTFILHQENCPPLVMSMMALTVPFRFFYAIYIVLSGSTLDKGKIDVGHGTGYTTPEPT
jgi:hypothetical protein